MLGKYIYSIQFMECGGVDESRGFGSKACGYTTVLSAMSAEVKSAC